MTAIGTYLFAAGLLLGTALLASLVKRLPLTMTMLYLGAGMVLGPLVLGIVTLDLDGENKVLERLAEVAVLVSVFSAGLKLRVPLNDRRWWISARLAWLSMIVTAGLISAAGFLWIGLPLGAALLLGGILAPTDPVLASDVQLEHAYDRDRLRFGLTSEAGLNDGTALSFVLLGLALLGVDSSSDHSWPWFAAHVAWGTVGGLGIGAIAGSLTARLFIYLRRTHQEAVGRDDFLALGLIALAYGVATLAHTYGFLSVFAAGVALRAVERQYTGSKPPDDLQTQDAAVDPVKAPAHMTLAMVTWNEQVERLLEVILVLIVGLSLGWQDFRWEALWFIPLLFLVIHPAAVAVGLIGSRPGFTQRSLMAWFGIRGIGSFYYLLYALGHPLPNETAGILTSLTLTTIACSILVHGISVTPLMNWYHRRAERRGAPSRKQELEVG